MESVATSFPILGASPQCPPYDPFQKSFVGEMVDTPFLAVPLSRPVDNGQPPRRARPEKSLFQLYGKFLGMPKGNKSTDKNGISVLYEVYRLLCIFEFIFHFLALFFRAFRRLP